MPSPVPRASRRFVLTGTGAAAGVLLVGAAAGCGQRQADMTGPAAVDPTEPAVDADSDLVETIGAQIAAALALAAATGAAFDQLRPLTRRLVAVHRFHLGELGRPDEGRHGTVKGSPATARARLLRSEETLQQRLVRAALDAESGALAQVFASMAAAIAQQRAVTG
ncbi:hypothetical protein [Nocardioides pelophilus]|uniref:hypothetical protein n=1 Tax=Nocardioides pelophilus TaxID=2172019 RepID=UPI00160039EC|nr:hypothetical protein [Nocardioides pelophilus]